MRIICAAGAAVVITGIVIISISGVQAAQTDALAQPRTAVDLNNDAVIDIQAPTPAPTPTPSPTPSPTPDPTLQNGMQNEEVRALQERLMKLGYLDLDESTDYFGSATEYAVQLFQRQHELAQDGIAGVNTLAMIYSDDAKKYTLLEGTSGTDVDSFQRQLIALGYLKKATGYYGTETIAAVKDFQDRNGLSKDGKAGEKTIDLIFSPDAKPSATKAKESRRKANISTFISVAKSKVGCKYILGNEGPKTFDCSGLVYYCLKEAGSNRGRYNAAGYSKVSDWEKISSLNSLQKGDIICFYNDAKTKVGHVGIYIGGGMMVDASSGNGKVMRRSCTTTYWKNHFYCARRPW